MRSPIIFDNVSKKFRRGERHDTLRDLIPALLSRSARRRSQTSLSHHEFWALRDVSFQVEPGEALGIIGPNGAGKSTTLKLLTKLLRPTTGRSEVRGRVGALIEVAAGFHPDLTGRENIFLQGAIMGMKRREIAASFDEIVDFSGTGEAIDTPVKRYSSGMSARLGFSIAAHLKPDVLIIDEVLSVGDMAFQQKCFDRMAQFKRDGVAIVLVSHNLHAISTLCERTVYLASSVQATGSTHEVISAYVDASAARQSAGSADVVHVASAELLRPSGVSGPQPDTAAGATVTFRVAGRSHQPLDDATFGLLVHRSADQLEVYHGEIHRREIGPATAFEGEFCLDISFVANLARGHYSVSFYAADNPTRRHLIQVRRIATITVSEHRSRSGIAHLDMAAELRSSVNHVPQTVGQ
jgi:lipopolysaccharide transport system ATP-binding protein